MPVLPLVASGRMRLALSLALVVLGCAGPSELPEPKGPARKAPPKAHDATADAFESTRFARVPAGTFGPYVADTKAGGVALWAEANERGRVWLGVTFDAAGQPRGQPQLLGKAPSEVGLATVEPAQTGFVLLATRRSGGRTALETLEVDARGKARGVPLTLAEVNGEVVWIDQVTTPGGNLALWGLKSPGGVDLFAALVGRERVEPKPVVQGARAWQAAGFGSGAAIGAVLPDARIAVQALDEHGAPTARHDVTTSPGAEADLDMVSSERGLLLAWTDHKDSESRVVVAALDAAGKLARPPKPLEDTLGETALVRLVAPHDGGGSAYLAWESLLERPAEGRALTLAKLGTGGQVDAVRATLEHASRDGSIPELAATPAGLAALTLGRACRAGQDCANAPLVPTFVELDGSLAVKASEPLRIQSLRGETPDLAWGLSCVATPCRVLAAQAVAPTPVWAVRAKARASNFVPSARRAERAGPPRVASLELAGKSEPLSDVALARVGSASLAAWVTYFDPAAPLEKLAKPAADGRLDPPRALLQVRAGALPAETISIRARSLGGVSLAASSSPQPEALLGWTALDFKLPQVFITVVDDKGKKLRQRMLTRAPGEKSDVAVAASGDGWTVAWVDERSGDPELYAARVNRLLQNVGPEKRITTATGAAAEVALLPRGQDVLAVWSDARDKAQPGVGDIYAALLKGSDASLSGSEQIVAKTPRHSRSPALAAMGKGALLAWIEETVAPSGQAGEAEVRVVELGADGRPIGSSSALGVSGPSAVTVDCEGELCRVAVLAQRDGGPELWAAEWSGGKAGSPVRLLNLTSPAPLTIAPGFVGREILLGDRAGAEGRARRVLVDWK